ncbi:DUF952 domain-containing protein [Microcoleus sp. FACHB-831]|uniref:DUF952 domain-containing protein n=1 Tax=Microcoleus sp. FACHB-831 TaxID=2692827 RepID=UPI001683CF37|nr:DUF952 domain-containing protein [Microcoleus sp. FACHB-831]MBD1922066.1 DUF952 domain-containing protein [Microcoleus sp. FACHB-831]
MSIILHITKRDRWEDAKSTNVYRGDTLESEGFIHCSTLEQVIKVANAFFKSQNGLVLLCLESEKVKPEIKYEGIDGGELFPHIYGALNIDAVVQVVAFESGEDGLFELPGELV